MAKYLHLIRHAIAEDRIDFADANSNDDLRPLTDKGIRKMHKNAHGMVLLGLNIDCIVCSPLVRARQTAEILAEYFQPKFADITESLCPDASIDELLTWLNGKEVLQNIVLVGHEPHLSTCLSYFLTGAAKSRFDIKKGSLTTIEFFEGFQQGQGQLKRFLTPKELRLIADTKE